MSSVSVSSDEHSYIEKLGKIFADSPVPHGQIFDDKRRWCGTCNRPMLTCISTTEIPWGDKMCSICHSLWPEFFNMFEEHLLDVMDELE